MKTREVIGLIGGLALAGLGIALALKKPPKEVEPGEWGTARLILGRYAFRIVIEGPRVFTLKLVSDPLWGGWITDEPDKPYYSEGEVVYVTAQAIFPYRFSHWEIDGVEDTRNPTALIVDRNYIITAHFSL